MPVGTSAYVALANVTLGSSATNVTFSNISQAYRDLIIVTSGTKTTANSFAIAYQFNDDSGANYHNLYAFGDGTSAGSGTQLNTSIGFINRISTSQSDGIAHIMDYSASDKHKTVISRGNTSNAYAIMYASRWANTAPITKILLGIESGGGSFTAGSTFALYGIAS